MATGPIKDMTGLADLELTGDECCLKEAPVLLELAGASECRVALEGLSLLSSFL